MDDESRRRRYDVIFLTKKKKSDILSFNMDIQIPRPVASGYFKMDFQLELRRRSLQGPVPCLDLVDRNFFSISSAYRALSY